MKQLKERGQGLVEYALLLVFIAVVVIGALVLLGPQINSAYNRVITALGGTVPYTYTITSGPTISSSFAIGACTYKLTMKVKVTDGGTAKSGESVSVAIAGGAAAGSVPTKTTNGGGVAEWENTPIKTVAGACQSGSSTVNVAGGATSASAGY